MRYMNAKITLPLVIQIQTDYTNLSKREISKEPITTLWQSQTHNQCKQPCTYRSGSIIILLSDYYTYDSQTGTSEGEDEQLSVCCIVCMMFGCGYHRQQQ